MGWGGVGGFGASFALILKGVPSPIPLSGRPHDFLISRVLVGGVDQKEQSVVFSYALHLHSFPAYVFPRIVGVSTIHPQAQNSPLSHLSHSYHESTASASYPLSGEGSLALFRQKS